MKKFLGMALFGFAAISACQPAGNEATAGQASIRLKSEEENRALADQMSRAFQAELECIKTERVSEWLEARREPYAVYISKGHSPMEDSIFNALNPRELLHYYLVFQEDASQICFLPFFEENVKDLIFMHLPFGLDAQIPSKRQREAIERNKQVIAPIVLECLRSHQDVSMPMLRLIAVHDIRLAAPVLIGKYASQGKLKNTWILSCLIELMENSEYLPWMQSQLRWRATGKNAVDLSNTAANANLILFYARTFAQYRTHL